MTPQQRAEEFSRRMERARAMGIVALKRGDTQAMLKAMVAIGEAQEVLADG